MSLISMFFQLGWTLVLREMVDLSKDWYRGVDILTGYDCRNDNVAYFFSVVTFKSQTTAASNSLSNRFKSKESHIQIPESKHQDKRQSINYIDNSIIHQVLFKQKTANASPVTFTVKLWEAPQTTSTEIYAWMNPQISWWYQKEWEDKHKLCLVFFNFPVIQYQLFNTYI